MRLIGFGQAAARFVRQLCDGAPQPLMPLLTDHLAWIEADGRFIGTDFEGLAIIFIVIGVDATDNEVGDAFMLAFRSHLNSVTTIGVFLRLEDEGPVVAPMQPPCSAEILMPLLMDLTDGYLDVPARM